MKLTNVLSIAKFINDEIGDNIKTDIVIYLNEAQHENLQQEVYKASNTNLIDYTSKKSFDIIILNIKFIVNLK